MAKPIKETPVLYDEDAYRFEMEAHHVTPLSNRPLIYLNRSTAEKQT